MECLYKWENIEMKKILIIHPEGNIHNNPNLLGMVNILCEQNFGVDVFSIKREEVFQGEICTNAGLHLFENKYNVKIHEGYVSILSLDEIDETNIINYFSNKIKKYDLVIGVDRGIIEASIISKIQNIPLGLISYEIFFADEAGQEFKNKEIDACANVSFAICQDNLRAKKLSEENKIDIEKIICIPVINRGFNKQNKNYYIYDKLNIPKDKKTAIYIGSLSNWGGLDYLIESTKHWNNEWVLILHSRYSDANIHEKIKETASDKIFVSTQPIDSVNDMNIILNSVDLGITYYKPTFDNIYSGKNLEYIGLASGKTFTYLSNNIPVCINEIGDMSDIVKNDDLGFVFDASKPLMISLSNDDIKRMKTNIEVNYSRKFNLDVLIKPMLNKIENLINHSVSQELPTQNHEDRLIAKNNILLATSLNPKGGTNQLKAFQSWLKAGFDVVSFNCPEEIEVLQKEYNDIKFVAVQNTAFEKVGKYLVYLNDVFKSLRKFPNKHFGIINSDIHLKSELIIQPEFISKLKEYIQSGVVYTNRIDIENTDDANGKEYEVGYDLFFFNSDFLNQADGLNFSIGLPWWDYYMVLTAMFNSFKIIKMNEPIAYHHKHPSFYKLDVWYEMGWTALDYTNKMTNAIVGKGLSEIDENDVQTKNAAVFKFSREILNIINGHTEYFSQEKRMEQKEDGQNDARRKDVLLSAIVSTYNSEKFMEGCLTDLINQTLYKKNQLEIIVVDSCSEQNEKAIVEKYKAKYRNIKYIRTDKRDTLYAAWNRGIKLAQGKYITNSNTDDRHRKDALEIMANELENDSDVELLYADCKQSIVANEVYEECSTEIIYNYPAYNPPTALLHYQFGPQPVWRKSVHDKIGLFDENLSAVGDYDFNIRFALSGLKAKKINEVLGLFYLNPNSITSTTRHQQFEKKQVLDLYTNEANIVKLFKLAGRSINTDFDIADVLNNFGVAALRFALPWSNKPSSNLELALLCFTSAKKYSSSNEIDNNIVQLYNVLKNGTKLNIDNFQSKLLRNDTKLEPLVKEKHQNKNITFLAGDLDNFTFLKPIIKYLKNKGYNAQEINFKGLSEPSVKEIIKRSDLIWYEWGNGPVLQMSKLYYLCPSICRIHRYEAYHETVKNINWFNIEKLLLINRAFVDTIQNHWDKNINYKTDIEIIPNPVSKTTKFKHRKNNFNIAYISRFQKDKNPALMIQILKRLVDIDNRYKVYMIGRIQDIQLYEYCLDLVDKLNLKNNFLYQGVIDEVETWLDDKSYLLSTSIVESQGLAIMEAMNMGIKPIIHNGFALDTIYPENLLYNTIEEAVQLITNSEYDSNSYKSFIEKSYSEEIILPKIERIINDLIESNNSRHLTNTSFSEDYNPLISICIPTYNRSKFIGEAIDSALNQTYQNYEIIIVDDGSTDNTEEVVKNFNSPKIKYFKKLHTGAPSTRNFAINKASGEFISWLDSDDKLMPNTLSAHVNKLCKFKDADVIYGDLIMTNQNNIPLRKITYNDWYQKNDALLSAIIKENPLPNIGSIVKKNVYERVGLFDEKFIRAHDYEWWSRAANTIIAKYNPIEAIYWRQHGGNLGAGSNKKVDYSYEVRIILSLLEKHQINQLFPYLNWSDSNFRISTSAALEEISITIAKFGFYDVSLKLAKQAAVIHSSNQLQLLINQLKNKIEDEKILRQKNETILEKKGLKITYLINSILGVTGGNQTLLHQANQLVELGCEVTIVTYTEKPSWFDIKARVIRVNPHAKMSTYIPPSDVVISTYFMNTHELLDSEAKLKIYYAQGDQFIFQDNSVSNLREDIKILKEKMRELSGKSYLLPGVKFIPNSNNLAKAVEQNYGRKADAILPVCVDRSIFKPTERLGTDEKLKVLIVGPDNKGSEIEPLIFKGIADIRESLNYLCNDDGERFQIIRMSNTQKDIFKDYPCEFYVAPSNETKTKLYGTADILIYASHYDSVPLPPLEAMSSGTAVICTETSGAKEYCVDGENCLLVPIKSPREIAEVLLKLSNDLKLRKRLIEGGLLTAQKMGSENSGKKLLQIIEKLLQNENAKELTNPGKYQYELA